MENVETHSPNPPQAIDWHIFPGRTGKPFDAGVSGVWRPGDQCRDCGGGVAGVAVRFSCAFDVAGRCGAADCRYAHVYADLYRNRRAGRVGTAAATSPAFGGNCTGCPVA